MQFSELRSRWKSIDRSRHGRGSLENDGKRLEKNIDPWRIIDTLYDRLYFSLFLHNTLALQREGLLQVIFTRDSFHNVRGFFLSFFLPFLSTRDNIDTRTKISNSRNIFRGRREIERCAVYRDQKMFTYESRHLFKPLQLTHTSASVCVSLRTTSCA